MARFLFKLLSSVFDHWSNFSWLWTSPDNHFSSVGVPVRCVEALKEHHVVHPSLFSDGQDTNWPLTFSPDSNLPQQWRTLDFFLFLFSFCSFINPQSGAAAASSGEHREFHVYWSQTMNTRCIVLKCPLSSFIVMSPEKQRGYSPLTDEPSFLNEPQTKNFKLLLHSGSADLKPGPSLTFLTSGSLTTFSFIQLQIWLCFKEFLFHINQKTEAIFTRLCLIFFFNSCNV